MNILGHAGLTLGAAYAATYIIEALWASRRGQKQPGSQAAGSVSSRRTRRRRGTWPLNIDYRMVLVGSLLPDLIDKPLGFWFAPELVNNSTRNIGHTLVFNLGLLMAALLFLRLAGTYRPLVLALSSGFHLVLDQMWQVPQRLLWPLYGWSFPPGTTTLDEYIRFMLSFTRVGMSEVVGLAILLWFAFQIYRQRAFLQFLKAGILR